MREAAVELADGDLALHAGELVAEAEVLAEGKREVFVGVSGQIELVGACEDVLVPVGRDDHPEHLGALGQDGAVEVDVVQQGPGGAAGDGGRVTQQFLDGGLGQGRVVAPELGLVGVLDEGEGRVADEVGRGVVAGQHEEEDHGDDLVVVEGVAVLAGLEEAP